MDVPPVVLVTVLVVATSLAAVGFVFVTRLLRRPAGPEKPDEIPLGDYSYTIDYLRHRVESLCHAFHLPSLAVALVDDQEIIWQEAFGRANVEENIPATVNTIYRLGSLTKLFTALEIMRLYQEGRLDLDAPVRDVLPDFETKSRLAQRMPHADRQAITVRSILVHRSGLPRNGPLPDYYWEVAPEPLARLTESLRNVTVSYPVGYRFKYSNIAYNVLGRIVEVLRELPADPAVDWPQYMKESLLAPIGMGDSHFGSSGGPGEPAAENMALGYGYHDRRLRPVEQHDIIHLASENLQASVADMSHYLRFLFRGGEAEGRQLLSPEVLGQMFEDQYGRPRDPQAYGLGWYLDWEQLSELVAFHSGIIQGTTSIIALLPERKLGLVLLCNSQDFDQFAHPLAFKVLSLMLETRYGKTRLEQPEPEPLPLDQVAFGRYVGKYILNGEVVTVAVKDGRPQLEMQGADLDLLALSPNEFQVRQPLDQVGTLFLRFFGPDEISAATMIVTIQGAYHTICPKYPEVDEVPELWRSLVGNYEIQPRIESAFAPKASLGRAQIEIDEDVLLMPSHQAALWPLSETEILLVGGDYDGETVVRDPASGELSWSSHCYKPRRGR